MISLAYFHSKYMFWCKFGQHKVSVFDAITKQCIFTCKAKHVKGTFPGYTLFTKSYCMQPKGLFSHNFDLIH